MIFVLMTAIFVIVLLWVFQTLKIFLKYGLILAFLILVTMFYYKRGNSDLMDAPAGHVQGWTDVQQTLQEKKKALIDYLSTSPDNTDGWALLSRVHEALGEKEGAAYAHEQTNISFESSIHRDSAEN